jgi:hypothetical protein
VLFYLIFLHSIPPGGGWREVSTSRHDYLSDNIIPSNVRLPVERGPENPSLRIRGTIGQTTQAQKIIAATEV